MNHSRKTLHEGLFRLVIQCIQRTHHSRVPQENVLDRYGCRYNKPWDEGHTMGITKSVRYLHIHMAAYRSWLALWMTHSPLSSLWRLNLTPCQMRHWATCLTNFRDFKMNLLPYLSCTHEPLSRLLGPNLCCQDPEKRPQFRTDELKAGRLSLTERASQHAVLFSEVATLTVNRVLPFVIRCSISPEIPRAVRTTKFSL